jgi:uncharacterized protein (TIGR00369 family)
MTLLDTIRGAKVSGNVDDIVAAIPYARFLGLSMKIADGSAIARLAYSDPIVGNKNIPALHGGTIGALLEFAGIFQLIWSAGSETIPKTINITIDYLRTARAQDSFARAEFVRQGRQIANVRAHAWQDDDGRPVAVASMHFLLGSDAG